jgi:phosphoglycerate dehydrogenase-like enzyme
VQVCGTWDIGHLTAELTLGLMLALARRTSHEERAMREGRWHVRLGHSVRGKTLGILGLGNLGRQVASFGRMLGMATIAWSQNLTAGAVLDVYSREPLPMDDPIRTLDNVVLLPHLGFVSEENYQLMYGDGLEAVEGFLAGKPVRKLNELSRASR